MNKQTENRLGGELRSQHTAARLLEELENGRYSGAAQLPSELELASDLGVSRTVVRDALSELERDGYLERVRGIGTLVNRDVVQLKNRMDQKLEFYKMIRAIGKEPRSDNLSVTREIASPALAEKLQLPTDAPQTLVFVRRRVMADDTPVLFSTDILPLSLFDNKRLEGIDFSQPIFDIAARHCHTEVTETVAHLHAVSGPAGIRRHWPCAPNRRFCSWRRSATPACANRCCAAKLIILISLILRWCASFCNGVQAGDRFDIQQCCTMQGAVLPRRS